MDPFSMAILGGSTLLGGLLQGGFQYFASKRAAEAQTAAAEKALAEQRRQYDTSRADLSPYTAAGVGALAAQQALAGLAGPQAQQAAISQLQSSPAFNAMVAQGEEGILQNAAATGGLRGGNTQAMLAQYRPQMLAAEIDRQYARLGGLTQLGQNSAAMAASNAMNQGQLAGGLLQGIGAAQAGGILGGFQGLATMAGTIPAIGGKIAGGFGGSTVGGASEPVGRIWQTDSGFMLPAGSLGK